MEGLFPAELGVEAGDIVMWSGDPVKDDALDICFRFRDRGTPKSAPCMAAGPRRLLFGAEDAPVRGDGDNPVILAALSSEAFSEKNFMNNR
jgi:hypothetical protein